MCVSGSKYDVAVGRGPDGNDITHCYVFGLRLCTIDNMRTLKLLFLLCLMTNYSKPVIHDKNFLSFLASGHIRTLSTIWPMLTKLQ